MSAPLTEQAAMLTIEAACRTLRLPTVRDQAAPLAEAAVRDRLTHRRPRQRRMDDDLGVLPGISRRRELPAWNGPTSP